MLLVLLFVLFAAVFCADGTKSGDMTVDIVCEPGKYIGDVTVTLTFAGAGDAEGKTSGVYYAINGIEEAKDTFPKDQCVGPDENNEEQHCTQCDVVEKRKDVVVTVVVPTTLVDEQNPDKGYKIDSPDLAINISNASSLLIKKGENSENRDTSTSPEKDFFVINSIDIKYNPTYNGEEGNPKDAYCPGNVYGVYPTGDCYEFNKLELQRVRFATGQTNGKEPTIKSNREIPNFVVTNVDVYSPLTVDVSLFPGIYQGNGNQSVGEDTDGIDTMTLTNFNGIGSGAVTFNIEGNVQKADWNKVAFETGAFIFNTSVRTTKTFAEEEVWCPGCTREIDDAKGYITSHRITDVEIPNGSEINIAGWVETIDANNFIFTATGNNPDKWTIGKTKLFTNDSASENTEFHVNNATFRNCKIGSDIHFSVRTLETYGTKATESTEAINTVFEHNVMSRSAVAKINNTTFKSYVRHEIRNGLEIHDSNYEEDTYYDHFENHKYYTLDISNVNIGNVDFVLSVDNGTESTNEPIKLDHIYCTHNVNDSDRNPVPEWPENLNNDESKVFLLRHMSKSVQLDAVQGCNLYFKNNVDNNPEIGGLQLSRPEEFTYTISSSDAEKNDYDHITIFDNAAFHVTTNINIYGIPNLGYVKFNRISIDQQSGKPEGVNLIHLPEVDPLNREGYGTSYPVNISIHNSGVIHKLIVSDDDSEGVIDPKGKITPPCDGDKLRLRTERDITFKEDTIYQNDDVNLDINECEIENIKIDADSLVLKGEHLLAHDVVDIKLADTSSLRFNDARFKQFNVMCHEALEFIMRHSVFDGDSSIEGKSESNIDMRTVLITNSNNVSMNFKQPAPFKITTDSGSINLNNIKVYYGDLEITNNYGDINVIQAFSVETFTKVDIRTLYGRLNVEHPKFDYYRDLNSVVNFENETGNVLGHEYAQTDVFAFATSGTMKPLTPGSSNFIPYVRSGYTEIFSKYGNISWSYADNLDITSKEYGKGAEIDLQGFDNVAVVSSLYAVGHETFVGLDIEKLDNDKTYLVTVHDKTIGDDFDNTNPVTLNETTCEHSYGKDSDHDAFDACFAYIVLPVTDVSREFNTSDFPKLTLDSENVFMKDCASSVLKSLTITNCSSVVIENLIAGSTDITLAAKDKTAYDWIRGTVYIGTSTFITNELKVTGASGVYNDVHISLARHVPQGIDPRNVKITAENGAQINVTGRTVIPSGIFSGIACSFGNEQLHNPNSAYDFCIGEISSSGSISFDTSSLNESEDYNVDIQLGSPSSDEPSNLVVTYASADTLANLVSGSTDFKLNIKPGDRIIVDNHLFATNFSNLFSAPFEDEEIGSAPTNSNFYVIPTSRAEASALVVLDTNADGMIYRSEAFSDSDSTTHKFNLIEQGSVYLYIPNFDKDLDNLSITTAGDNINLILSDIGVYDRIYTTSYLIANVLRAKTVYSVASMVYSLQAAESFITNIGSVGINLDKANADVIIEADEDDNAPIVVLKEGSISDLGIYSRNYKTVYNCSGNLYSVNNTECSSVVVPCRDDQCEFVNYIWSPKDKYFWAGNNYKKSVKNNDKMTVMFKTDFKYFQNQCPTDGRGVGKDKVKCPNTPVYSENIKFMSSINIIGKPKITADFEQSAFKNNRYIDPNNLTGPETGMPDWAIGLIVLGCIIAAVLIVMFVLTLLKKETLGGASGSGLSGSATIN